MPVVARLGTVNVTTTYEDTGLEGTVTCATAALLATELLGGISNLAAILGAGREPLTTSMLFSASTLRTSRLKTLTRSLPMWPAIRMPGKTRDGHEDAPMEPG